ncbi:tumor protein p53-inducible protein 11-like isoform X2 [Amphiura filiformis]|uniref:tumor protein p53-inducible protein 11-like isoform X2 n=1 Tax=Amphiura filiformis TaxID=82378 RepID=UPI003B21AD3A
MSTTCTDDNAPDTTGDVSPPVSPSKKNADDFDFTKQSSGDLQSRLKTRKLLGVGENEDGSVPLSKISQILGHDDHYLINLPAGLRLWQVTTAVAFTAIASLAMCFPVGLFETVFASSCGQESVLPIRLFGGAITCLALLYWSAIKSVSRHIIRWTLLTEILYLTIQTLVMFLSLLGNGAFSFSSILVLALFVMSITISIHFYATLSGISSRWLWATYQAITSDLTGSDKTD